MRFFLKAGLLVAGGLLLCSNAAAVELLYPLDGTYVVKSRYLVIKGGQDPMLDGFAVGINGVMSDVIDVTGKEYRKAFADMLILEPLFDPGENKIVVEGYLHGERFAGDEATIYYADNFDSPAPEGYEREVFHFPEREAACAACHVMSPTPEMLSSPQPKQNACGVCHVRMLGKDHVHGPAGVFECTFCHDSDSQPNKYQARPGDAELCVECHDGKMDEYLQSEFVHGPVEAGLCMVCHDPHASDQPAQLIAPVNDLCLACHSQVRNEKHVTTGPEGKGHPLSGGRNPANPLKEFHCASCHNPHAGNTRALFRFGAQSRMGLCGKCHNK